MVSNWKVPSINCSPHTGVMLQEALQHLIGTLTCWAVDHLHSFPLCGSSVAMAMMIIVLIVSQTTLLINQMMCTSSPICLPQYMVFPINYALQMRSCKVYCHLISCKQGCARILFELALFPCLCTGPDTIWLHTL